ncbi:MAG: hypothetical protein ACRCRT_00180 [Cetobacterium somerae]
MKRQIFVDPKSGVVFGKVGDKPFEPIGYDYNTETKQATPMTHPIWKDLIRFVKDVSKVQDKKTGKDIPQPLFPLQWSILILAVRALLEKNSEMFLWAISRQAGKSFLIGIIVPFAVVYMPKYVDVPTMRYTVVMGSYKDDAVKELYKKIKPKIQYAVDHYNKHHKDKLITKDLDPRSRLKDNVDLIEIDKEFTDGTRIAYGEVRNITCGSSQDGLSAYLLVLDEAGLINAQLFRTSMANFTSSTGGITCFAGVPCSDASSVFYWAKGSRGVKTMLYQFPDVYKHRKLISESLAQNYKNDYEKKVKVASGGIKNTEIQWNYYLNTDDIGGKFMSRERLDDNNVLMNLVRKPVGGVDRYKVAGIDVSASGDYKVMTIGETTVIESYNPKTREKNRIYRSDVCDIITFNKDGIKQTGEKFAELCVKKCMEYELDMVAIDSSSAGGQMFTQQFNKYMVEFGVDIMVLPFAYNQNKSFLFGYLEDCIYTNKIKLLKEFESWESEQLVEEMLYMLKKHMDGKTTVQYFAPKGDGFYDDHVNSLALFNICVKEIYERSINKRRRLAEDGSGRRWTLRVQKYSQRREKVLGEHLTNEESLQIWKVL